MRETEPQPTEAGVQAWARLVRASQSLLARVEADLKKAGYPPLAWYDALLELKRAEPDGLRPVALQAQMLLTQYNVSRLCDRLVRAGYATSRPSPEDGRGVVLTITADGQDVLAAMWPIYRRAIWDHFAARLDADDVAALSKALAKLV